MRKESYVYAVMERAALVAAAKIHQERPQETYSRKSNFALTV